MADITVPSSMGNVKYKDLGDGETFAPVVAVEGATGTGGADLATETTLQSVDTRLADITRTDGADSNPLVRTGGTYNATPPTYSDGQDVADQFDSKGNKLVNLAVRLDPTNDAITAYPYGHGYTAISTATTTVVKSGAGVLREMTVTGGTTGTIVVYDNTAASGTKIADFDTTNALAAYLRDIAFTTGLTIVTSAATKITVAWR